MKTGKKVARPTPDPAGTPLEPQDAWPMFDEWRAHSRRTGILFLGSSGSVTSSGTVTQARMGRLQFNSETAEVSFRLKSVNFTYGPVKMYPNWPNPPAVEVIAVPSAP